LSLVCLLLFSLESEVQKMNIPSAEFSADLSKVSVSKLLNKAQKALKHGDTNTAILAYHAILNRYPKNKKALMGIQRLQSINPLPDLIPLIQQKKFSEVEQILLSNIERDQNNANFWKLLGIVYHEMEQASLSLQCYQKSLDLNPHDHELMFQIGVDFLNGNDIANAFKTFKLLTQINPKLAAPFTNLGVIYDKVNRLDEAKREWTAAIQLDPKDTVAISYLGVNSIKSGDYTEGLRYFGEVEKLQPDDVNNCVNIATAYFELGETEKAIELYQTWENKNWSGASEAQKYDFRLNYSLALFSAGLVAKGWEHYASRRHADGICPTDLKELKIPRLENIIDAQNKSILLLMEQGVGDQLHFLGLLNCFKQKTNAKITIQTEPRLVNILQSSFDNISITNEVSASELNADYWILYGDLGELLQFGIRKDAVCSPYIHTSHKLTKTDKKLFSNDRTNVGLVWRSGLIDGRRLHSYTFLSDWVPMLRDNNLNIVSLQYSDISQDLAEIDEKIRKNLKIPTGDLRNDFELMAALINECDYVVGPSTAPVQQALAQGKKTLTYGLKGTHRWSFGDGMKLNKYKHRWYRNGEHFVFNQSNKSALVQQLHNHILDMKRRN